jgi:hypothetical protein
VNALRNVFVDLVDKRLWPIAIVLIVAVFAVPVLLAKPASKPTPGASAVTPNVAPPNGLPAPGTKVALAGSGPGGGQVTGAAHDPFQQIHGTVATATTVSTAATGAASTTGGATTGAFVTTGSTTGSTTGATTGTTTPTTTTTATGTAPPTPEPRTQVVLRFGVSPGSRPQRSLDPLTPLPSVARPLFVYLGAVNSNTRAVFLVSADVDQATGEGRCTPDKTICSQVELRAGQTEYFTVQTSKGTVRYRLDVVKLKHVS